MQCPLFHAPSPSWCSEKPVCKLESHYDGTATALGGKTFMIKDSDGNERDWDIKGKMKYKQTSASLYLLLFFSPFTSE